MFSSRLRSLPEWTTAMPQLTNPDGLNLQQRTLSSHDISLVARASITTPPNPARRAPRSFMNAANTPADSPLRPSNSSAPSANRSTSIERNVRFLLLTSPDLAPSRYNTTLDRLQNFATQGQGCTLTVVFLLKPFVSNTASQANADTDFLAPGPWSANASRENARNRISAFAEEKDTHSSPEHAYMQLQSAILAKKELREGKMVVLPLREASGLGKLIDEVVRAVVERESRALRIRNEDAMNEAKRAIQTLLPLCSTLQPLSEHCVLLLTDLYSSVSEFGRAMRKEEERQKLIDTFENDSGPEGKRVGESIVAFWMSEWMCD